MKRLNVRWRLTLWYGAVLAAIVGGFGVCVYLMMHRHLVARTDFELDEELTELALEVRLAQDDDDLLEQLQRRFSSHASFDFQVDKVGVPTFFTSERIRNAPLQSPARIQIEQSSTGTVNSNALIPGLGQVRVASRLATGKTGEFLIHAMTSLFSTRLELNAILVTLFTAGPLAIAAALVGGYFLARNSLAPVDRMATVAELITGARLRDRIEVANPDDELGHLARTFNSMLDRLEHAVEELRRFTADAAHELRTPLAVLQTEAEVALRIPRSAEAYRGVIEVSLRETKRLARLTDGLLTLSRHDYGFDPRRHEDVPVHALVADVIEQLRVVAEAKGISLEVASMPECTVLGNDIQLSQLFFNLLENAIKFTNHGGTVTVKGEILNGELQSTISDTGTGISEQDLPHVFDRFYRADKSRNEKTGGAGLGLSIAKAIVAAHQGTIAITSTLGAGTTIDVRLSVTHEATELVD